MLSSVPVGVGSPVLIFTPKILELLAQGSDGLLQGVPFEYQLSDPDIVGADEFLAQGKLAIQIRKTVLILLFCLGSLLKQTLLLRNVTA